MTPLRLVVVWSPAHDWSVRVMAGAAVLMDHQGSPSVTTARAVGHGWVNAHHPDVPCTVDVQTAPRDAVVPWQPDKVARIRTARAGAPVEPGTARILVERWYPAWVAHGFFTAWWDHLAPPTTLSAAYRRGDIDWTEYAYEYLAHFDDIEHPSRYWQWVSSDVAGLLRRYDSVTFIGARPAPEGDERAVRCHRRLLVAWLCGDDISLGIDS